MCSATGPLRRLMVFGFVASIGSACLPPVGASCPSRLCPTACAGGNATPPPLAEALSPADGRRRSITPRACAPWKRATWTRRRRLSPRQRKADPSNRDYALDLQIARQHRVTKLVQDADKARLMGQPDVARAKLAEALALDPKNPEVSQHIDDLANLASPRRRTAFLTATFAPAIELTPKPGKQSFHFKSTEQEVLRRVLDAYGLRMVADDSLARRPFASTPMTWTMPRPRTC
jgi:hypothetical protein